MNRPLSMIYPDTSKHEDHTYDPAGNVASYKNRSGAVQTFAYDNRNRATSFTWTNDPANTTGQTTVYDAASRKIEIDNADATVAFTYDNANRLTAQTETEITTNVGDNVARTVAYHYDADGNRDSIQYPSGTKFDYAYTQRKQVASITLDGQQTPVVSYLFDPSGNITSRSLDNRTSTAYTVDAVNRDTAVVHGLLPAGTTKRFDYAYNSVNDIVAVKRDSDKGEAYEYDLTQQIKRFAQNGNVDLNSGTITSPATDNNMLFDGCGNRTALNGANQTFNSLNQPNGIPHDGNGNLQSYNGWIYTYDAQNRLKTAINTSTAVTANFYYDGLNRQVARAITAVGFIVWLDAAAATKSVGKYPTKTKEKKPD